MAPILDIPEVAALDARRGLIRIPPETDVPLTPRVRQLIDTAEFRRLARISQLGLVSLVYPAAIHTRFEHSLGVYRLALLYLKQLANDERFTASVSRVDAELLVAAALLHDLGHWPFCHPIEDIRLPSVPNHELYANSFILEGEIADVLRHDWDINPRDVVALLNEKPRAAGTENPRRHPLRPHRHTRWITSTATACTRRPYGGTSTSSVAEAVPERAATTGYLDKGNSRRMMVFAHTYVQRSLLAHGSLRHAMRNGVLLLHGADSTRSSVCPNTKYNELRRTPRGPR